MRWSGQAVHTGDISSRMNSFPSIQEVQSLLAMLPAPLRLSTLMPLAHLTQLLSICKETESGHPTMLGI